MKKYISIATILLFALNVISFSQNLDNAPFNLNKNTWTILPSPNNTRINIENDNSLSFFNLPGAIYDMRIYQKLSFQMPETFTVGFNFNVKNVGKVGAALLPLVFTAGNLAPSNPDNQANVQTNQDALGIIFQTPLNDSINLQIAPYVKIGATPQVTLYNNFIKIDKRKAYTIILRRCTKTKVSLTVLLNNALVGKVAFGIPANFKTLTYVQSSNMVQASSFRKCTGTINQFFYTDENKMSCEDKNPPDVILPPTETNKTVASTSNNTGIIDYEDMTSFPIEKVNPGCCQIAKVQFGENKGGYITEDINRGKVQLSGCSSDVLATNRSVVFPGRRTVLYVTNMPNDLFKVQEIDTSREQFQIFKNKELVNNIIITAPTRKKLYFKEEFKRVVNGKYTPILTNQYFYNRLGDDFPAYSISYKNGDSSKYIKINYFGKKRNINNFTVWNSETNSTVNYTVVRDNDKYTRFWNGNPLHYYVGLQTPENPTPVLNVFCFAGDLITDIIPDKEIDGATKIHFDYTFLKKSKSFITSLKGTNGTYITYEYDCNNVLPEVRKLPPPPPKETQKTDPVNPPPVEIKKPKNVMDPKEMIDIKRQKETIKKDSVLTPIIPKKG